MSDETRTSVEISRALREPLYGTISPTDVFFLLEYNGIYTKRAWEDARIPDEVKERLATYPNSKPLLIRQPGQIAAHDRKVQFFVVHTAAEKPVYYHFDLADYDELLTLNLDAVLAGTATEASTTPLYAVCTNGRRDVCCSKYGIPVYETLAQIPQTQVWQASHFGGHRFAGTMLCFPHGIAYGGLNGTDVTEVASAYENGDLVLRYYRGRTTMIHPAQAADYFLRREFDLTAIMELTLVEDNYEPESETWRVRFERQGQRFEVMIRATEPLRVLSTTGADQWKEIPQYRYDGFQRL